MPSKLKSYPNYFNFSGHTKLITTMIKNTLTFCLLLGWATGIHAQKLELPESAVYDATSDTYFISSIKHNVIFRQNKAGKQSIFTEIQSHSLGLAISNKTLYVVSDDQILGFDIQTKKQNFMVTIPDANQLNDITADDLGNLYISDRLANIIYKVTVKTKKFEQFTKPNSIPIPNGIFYDPQTKFLYVCTSTDKGEIYQVDLENGAAKLLYKSIYGNFDGIAVDADRNIYVTSWDTDWKNSKLVKFAKNQNNSTVLMSNTKGMADLNYNFKEHKLIIANTLVNSISVLNPKALKAIK